MSEDYQQIEFRLSIMSDPNSRDAAEAIRDLRARLTKTERERDEAREVVDQLSGVAASNIRFNETPPPKLTECTYCRSWRSKPCGDGCHWSL